MATREVIREVIDLYTDDGCLFPDKTCVWHSREYCTSDNDSYACLMQRLDKLGVVIKVENQTIQVQMLADGKNSGLTVPYHLENLGKNIVAVEPLIKEEKC